MKGFPPICVLACLAAAPPPAAAAACDGAYQGVVIVRHMQREESWNTIEFTVKDGRLEGTYRAYSLSYPLRGKVDEQCRIKDGVAYSTNTQGGFPMVGTATQGQLMRGSPYSIEYTARKVK